MTPRTASGADELRDGRTPLERMALVRAVQAPIRDPAGTRAFERRVRQREIVMRYEIGGEERVAVAASLGLSLRQFHRERRAALDAIDLPVDTDCGEGEAQDDRTIFDAESAAVARAAAALPFAEASRRHELLLAGQTDSTSQLRAHLAFYEFLAARNAAPRVRRESDVLDARLAAADPHERRFSTARKALVDARISWQSGDYDAGLRQAERARTVLLPDVDRGIVEETKLACEALQLEAQLAYELADPTRALELLDHAERIIARRRLAVSTCGVSNAVGRADLLLRSPERVHEAIAVATAGFDAAAACGASEDGANALLLIAMARSAQRDHSEAMRYVTFTLQVVDDLSPVGKSRILVHGAEIAIASGALPDAQRALARARSAVPKGSVAAAQLCQREARLAAAQGDLVAAATLIDAAVADLEGKRARLFVASALDARARIRDASGDRSGAIADLEAAVANYGVAGYAWTRADMLGRYGRLTQNRAAVREADAIRGAFSMRAS